MPYKELLLPDLMTNAPQVSLIIVIHNEAKRLEALVQETQLFLNKLGLHFELILIADPSSDETQNILKNLSKTYDFITAIYNERPLGRGNSILKGLHIAKAPYIFSMSADFSAPLAAIVSFLTEFYQAPETAMIIGDRTQTKRKSVGKQAKKAEIMQMWLNQSRLLDEDHPDLACSFWAVQKKYLEQINLQDISASWFIGFRLAKKFTEKKLKVLSLPISWHHNNKSQMPLRTWLELFRR